MKTRRVPYTAAVPIVVTTGDETAVRDAFVVLRPVLGAEEMTDIDASVAALMSAGARAVRTDVRREVITSPDVSPGPEPIPDPLGALNERLADLLSGERLERGLEIASDAFSTGY